MLKPCDEMLCAHNRDVDETELELLLSQASDWTQVWHQVMEDVWFQTQLRRTAKRLVRRHRREESQVDDLIQDVCLLIARQAMRRSDLGYDAGRGTFRSYMRGLIRNFCLQSLDRSRKPNGVTRSLKQEDLVCDDWRHSRHVEELRELIDEIPEPAHTSVQHFLAGESIEEIALRTGYATRTVYRHLHLAVDRLQHELDFFDRAQLPRRPRGQRHKSHADSCRADKSFGKPCQKNGRAAEQ